MGGRARTVRLFACLLIVLLPARIVWAGPGGPVVFPGTTEVLRVGDIVLVDTPSLRAALDREFGIPYGPYTHAMVYLDLPGEGGRLVDFSTRGFTEADAGEVLGRTFQGALLRSRQDAASKPLGAIYLEMRERYRRGAIYFDMDMRWTEKDDGSYYCAGFISHLFRKAGLEDPFPLAPFVGRDEFIFKKPHMVRWAAENIALDLTRIVSVNAPLFLSGYVVLGSFVSTDESMSFMGKEQVIITSVLHVVSDYFGSGYSLREPSWGSRIVAGVMSLRDPQDLDLGRMPEKRRAAYLAAFEFMTRVHGRAVELVRSRAEKENWSDADIAEVTRRVADHYRDDYFFATPR
jgi:hypothetical protein